MANIFTDSASPRPFIASLAAILEDSQYEHVSSVVPVKSRPRPPLVFGSVDLLEKEVPNMWPVWLTLSLSLH